MRGFWIVATVIHGLLGIRAIQYMIRNPEG